MCIERPSPYKRGDGGDDTQFSDHSHSKFEPPTSVSLLPEGPRRGVDIGSREDSPDVRDVYGGCYGMAGLRAYKACCGAIVVLTTRGLRSLRIVFRAGIMAPWPAQRARGAIQRPELGSVPRAGAGW